MQDAAIHEILDLVRSIDRHSDVEGEGRAIVAGYMHRYRLTRLKAPDTLVIDKAVVAF